VLRTPNLDVEEALRAANQEAGRPTAKAVAVISILTPVVEIKYPREPATADRTELHLGYSVQLPSPDDSLRLKVQVDGAVSCSNGMTDAQEKSLIEALRKVDAHGDVAPASSRTPHSSGVRRFVTCSVRQRDNAIRSFGRSCRTSSRPIGRSARWRWARKPGGFRAAKPRPGSTGNNHANTT
jgi:hypothetical protein